jgi:hypothetical protein
MTGSALGRVAGGGATRTTGATRKAPWHRRPALVVAAMGWYLLGIIGLLLDSGAPDTGDTRALLMLSTTALLFGLWVFWYHGGKTITAVGTYNFAFALFIGLAGLHLLFWGVPGDSVVPALAWCYFGNVTTWLMFWTKGPPNRYRPRPVDSQLLRRATWIGVLIACAGLVLSLGPIDPLFEFGTHVTFVGMLLVAIGTLSDSRQPPWLGLGLAVSGFLLSLAVSTGYGRLMVGSLGIALLVVLSRRLRTRIVKGLTVLASAPVLLILADIRNDALRANHPDVEVTGTGLESMAGPLKAVGMLLDYYDAGILTLAWGKTFWAALIWFIPRPLWPTKPIGFGAELVSILHPQLVNTGHSEAALFQGEWLYNFGLAGLVLMVPVVGLAIWAVDRSLTRVAARPLTNARALLWYATAIVVIAGLPDLVWVGSFQWAVRTGTRMLVLAGGWFLLVVRSNRDSPEPPAARHRAVPDRHGASHRHAVTVPDDGSSRVSARSRSAMSRAVSTHSSRGARRRPS